MVYSQNTKTYIDRLLQKLDKKYTQNGEYLFQKLQNRVVDKIRSTKINHYN